MMYSGRPSGFFFETRFIVVSPRSPVFFHSFSIASGVIPDPNAPIDPNTGLPMENNIQGSSGQVPIDPKIDEKDMEPPTEKEI